MRKDHHGSERVSQEAKSVSVSRHERRKGADRAFGVLVLMQVVPPNDARMGPLSGSVQQHISSVCSDKSSHMVRSFHPRKDQSHSPLQGAQQSAVSQAAHFRPK